MAVSAESSPSPTNFFDFLEDLFFDDDDKDPLHNPSDEEELRETLMKESTDPNSLNKKQNAPIHSIVKKKAANKKERLKKTSLLVTLLTYGDVDIDKATGAGETALHVATKCGDHSCVKTLIAYGAEVDVLDRASLTPLDHVEGPSNRAERPAEESVHSKQAIIDRIADTLKCSGANCSEYLPQKCTIMPVPRFKRYIDEKGAGVMKRWTTSALPWYYSKLEATIEQRLANTAVPLTNTPDEAMALAVQMRELRMFQKAGSRILFLDGGGIRGLLQIELLLQIERSTGRKITELFDWIAGTSTGGMLALAMVYAKKPLSELRKFYFRARAEVFHDPKGGVSYDTDLMEEILIKEYGTELKMSDVTYPRVIIPATYKKNLDLHLHFFNNFFDDEFSSQPVWKVARYTSAAPIYFTELDNYVDGGLLASNPSTSCLTVIQQYFKKKGMKLPISLVVSLGTGKLPSNVEMGNIDATDYLYFGKHWFNLSSLGDRIKSLTTLLGNALTDAEVVADNCRARCQEQRIAYYRFNPELKEVIPAGEDDIPTLINMIITARRLTTDNPQFAQMVTKFHELAECNRKMVGEYVQQSQGASMPEKKEYDEVYEVKE